MRNDGVKSKSIYTNVLFNNYCNNKKGYPLWKTKNNVTAPWEKTTKMHKQISTKEINGKIIGIEKSL